MIETVNNFIDAFARRSTAECLACFKPSDSTMVFGTAADEKRIGIEAIRQQLDRNFAQSLAATMQMTWHTSAVCGDAGWVAADFLGRFKTPEAEGERPLRATFVLERVAHARWLITHMHLSFPDVQTAAGHSFPSAG